jgi:serralysin
MNHEIRGNETAAGTAVITFSPNDIWTVDPNTTIESSGTGVETVVIGAQGHLLNNGNVVSLGPTLDAAVEVDVGGAGSMVFNATGAMIEGYSDGINVFAPNTVAVNHGNVFGLTELGVDFGGSSGGSVFSNFGQVFGQLDGVFTSTMSGTNQVNNFGVLNALGAGIEAVAVLTTIVNGHKGVIEGTMHGIDVHGAITFHNAGTVIGGIDCLPSSGSNVIVNQGRVIGSVLLGTGHDVFNGQQGTSGSIFADGGNARILAGMGRVQIHVGGGSDTLTCGTGADRLIFDSPLANQVEKIKSFKIGIDKIVLSAADFLGIETVGSTLTGADFTSGSHATKGAQRIIYDAQNGFLFYDPDGNAPSAEVHFATLAPHLALSHTDFLVAA